MCGCLSHSSYWGSGPHPKYVPWLGIKPMTLWFAGQHSVHWATPARVKVLSSCYTVVLFWLVNKLGFSVEVQVWLGCLQWSLGKVWVEQSPEKGALFWHLKDLWLKKPEVPVRHWSSWKVWSSSAKAPPSDGFMV